MLCLKAIIGVFLFIFISDWVIHGVLLKNQYAETAALWRTEESIIPWALFGGQALIAIFFVAIFRKGYEGKGMIEGVRYGFLMAAFTTGSTMIQYAVAPYPLSLIGGWIGLGFLQSIGAGMVAAAVYGKSKP